MCPPDSNGPGDAGSSRGISNDPGFLASAVRAGNRRALARSISLVEDDRPEGHEVVRLLYPETGRASITGFTGAPGVGKSSLIAASVAHLRAEGADRQIGVVSVDPSSPFTHGALLGDRIRLGEHFLDRGVFIRSMGTRGHLGGLAESSLQVALLFDAFGMDEVLIETVGVGQSEVEVVRIADTVILVLMPGSGDSVQALKAGIMEIPDIVVINKADHPHARELHQHVRSILNLGGRSRMVGHDSDAPAAPHDEWRVPIVETQANTGIGVPELWTRVAEHRSWLVEAGRLEARRRENLSAEIFSLAAGRALDRVRNRAMADPRLAALLERVHDRELDPLSCVVELYREVFSHDQLNGAARSTPSGAHDG